MYMQNIQSNFSNLIQWAHTDTELGVQGRFKQISANIFKQISANIFKQIFQADISKHVEQIFQANISSRYQQIFGVVPDLDSHNGSSVSL